jgi:hypothetical protein
LLRDLLYPSFNASAAQTPTQTRLIVSPPRLPTGKDGAMLATVWAPEGIPEGSVRFRRTGTPSFLLGEAELRPLPRRTGPISMGFQDACMIAVDGGILC